MSWRGGVYGFVPTADNVFKYIESRDEGQLPIEKPKACMSVYNLCE